MWSLSASLRVIFACLCVLACVDAARNYVDVNSTRASFGTSQRIHSRPPTIPRPPAHFRWLADSDGITRTAKACTTSDGLVCDLCCDGVCCERVSSVQKTLGSKMLWIPIHFIELSAQPLLKLSDLSQQIVVLNKNFAAASLYFYLHSYTNYTDTRMIDSCNTDPCYISATCDFYTYTIPKATLNAEGVVNVYICQLDYLGESQWPWIGPEKDPLHYIQVAYKGFANLGTSYYNLGKTLVHEMGHYMGLLHVFERPDLCDVSGDYVDDTPRCSKAAKASDACTKLDDTCPDETGYDPHNNLMNYASDACMENFSWGQIDRMHQAINKYRSRLRAATAVNGTCPSTTSTLESCTCENGLSPLYLCASNPASTAATTTTSPSPTTISSSSIVSNPTVSAGVLNTTSAITATSPMSSVTPTTTRGATMTPTPDEGSSTKTTVIIIIIVCVVGAGIGAASYCFYKRLQAGPAKPAAPKAAVPGAPLRATTHAPPVSDVDVPRGEAQDEQHPEEIAAVKSKEGPSIRQPEMAAEGEFIAPCCATDGAQKTERLAPQGGAEEEEMVPVESKEGPSIKQPEMGAEGEFTTPCCAADGSQNAEGLAPQGGAEEEEMVPIESGESAPAERVTVIDGLPTISDECV